jgi:hypothetical protein
MDGSIKSPGTNRRWRESFRCRGSRQTAAVAQLSALGYFTMRCFIPILIVTATVLVGCHSPSQVHTQKPAPTVATLPPFHPMFVTVFGIHPSPDGSWKIGVS